MIARGAPAGTVCLRCLLRQSSPLPVRYIANNATAAASGNTDADADAATSMDSKANRADDRIEGQDAVEDADQNRQNGPRAEPLPGKGVKYLNLHNRHKSGNRILNEVSRSLNHNMLGTPAFAIVMKDGGTWRRKLAELKQYKAGSEAESTSIEELLERQRGPADTDEARVNIHSLRPEADRVLSRKEFEKLQCHLTSGFLNAQLQDYILWYKSEAWRDSLLTAPDTSSQPEFRWIKKMTAWVPLQSETNVLEGTDLTLQGYISEATTPKQRLAIRLMRECWGLSIAELQTQLGEVWIKLDNHDFVTLMRGTQRFTKQLVKIWLEPGEQIEAFRSQKMLRLVTTKPKVDAVIRDLNKTMQCITTKALPIVLLGSKMPDDTILEQVGKITNSHVRKSHTSRRLHITWIDIKSRAARRLTGLEDIAHIVFRLLLTVSGSKQVTSTLLSPASTKAHRGRLFVDVTSKEKLGWKDRLTQWARYVHPLTPEKGVADTALPIKKFELPFQPLAGSQTLKDDLEFFPESEFPAHPVKWSNTRQTSTTAHFGRILHPYQPSNPTPALPELLASTERRVFAPSTPHPLHLARLESSHSGSSPPLITTKSTLVLRFWPSPSSDPITRPDDSKSSRPISKHAGDAPPAPILELRLAASDTVVLGVESLRAIAYTHHTDIMLPSSSVDVRFTQTQYETLQARDRETLATWQPLLDFLGASRLELANGKLEMPPRQRFPIPQRLIATADASTSTGSSNPTTTPSTYEDFFEEKPPSSDPEKLVSVSYEFVGLELHRSAVLPFEGHQLTYTSVEAGQGGGRRAELTLNPVELNPATFSSGEVAATDKHLLQEDFLACCSRLVTDSSLWSGLGDRNI